jgi:hypothetical protein
MGSVKPSPQGWKSLFHRLPSLSSSAVVYSRGDCDSSDVSVSAARGELGPGDELCTTELVAVGWLLGCIAQHRCTPINDQY